MITTRRGFLQALGIGAAAVAAETLVEPARKLWFVGSTAPVGSRIERVDFLVNPKMSHGIVECDGLVGVVSNEDLYDGYQFTGQKPEEFAAQLDALNARELSKLPDYGSLMKSRYQFPLTLPREHGVTYDVNGTAFCLEPVRLPMDLDPELYL